MDELKDGGEDLYKKLYQRNALDLELHHFAKGLFLTQVSDEILNMIAKIEAAIRTVVVDDYFLIPAEDATLTDGTS